ncbi:NAD(P)/FAD-dependent oxidoreductase [Chitinophaga sp. GCM10012297]|uniref:Geranylgeranyl reductase family protein n=1 Tax=Chitinophaga chungangae TaxID=2821488 RepID=A0ABS3YC95_9BACT|nr:geranylgeranyl reductase family protein [Chitinophaga chungangae]MBO9152281.1 geranylgeranyl reductase family protein [Chitinophaga chungangae]
MDSTPLPVHFDVIIIGAGPAGSASALALRNSGLRIAIIDKHVFPRDKVCGDAIPGRAIKFLNEIDPSFAASLAAFGEKLVTRRTLCYYNNKVLDFSWSLEAYTAARQHFDDFLFSRVKQLDAIQTFENTAVQDISRNGSGYAITTKNGRRFTCTLLIGADGVNGITAKKLTDRQIDRKHHVAGVRAYYSGVSDMDASCTEVYFDRKYLPGYFWVFPLKDGTVNAGMGILSDEVVKNRINVKQAFYDFIERSDVLKHKFRNATPLETLQGCGLPMGSRWVPMSGDHFLLAGDAASLIDPVSGDGIGNAVLSGKLAAEQALRCFASGDFSVAFVKTYEQQLFRAAGADMRKKTKILKTMARMPFLFNAAFVIGKNKVVRHFMK